ncbi:MAG: hypothetical protein E6K85_06740 [Thaumarchaeota archaeon]|nr:MAG: hypothetical protein E6K85_06740 [Nitrososphaerota archaeon]
MWSPKYKGIFSFYIYMLSLSSLEVNPLLPVSIDSVDPIIGSSGVSGTDGVLSSGEISVYAAGTGAELNRGFGAAFRLAAFFFLALFRLAATLFFAPPFFLPFESLAFWLWLLPYV